MMLRRSTWSMALLVAGCAGMIACGSLNRPDRPNKKWSFRMHGSMFASSKLYTFAVLPDRSSRVVRVDVRYPIGAAHDPAGKEGLAHLVEHLLFEVELPKQGGKTSISAELGRVSLEWNAFTALDYTQYQTVAKPDKLAEVLRLEAARLAVGCKGITPEVFAREKEIVLNEMRERGGANMIGVRKAIRSTLYPERHPYRKVATLESVATLTREDVCKFIATKYRQGQAYVVVSGAVTTEGVKYAAARTLGRLPPRIAGSHQVPDVSQTRSNRTAKVGVTNTTYIQTWQVPPTWSRDYRVAQMVAPIIAYRVNQFAMTYKWGYGATTMVLGGDRAPYIAIAVTLHSKSGVSDAREAIGKAVQYAGTLLYRSGEPGVYWNMARAKAAESLMGKFETLSTRAELFADLMQYDPRSGLVIGRLQELERLKPAQARKLIEEMFASSRSSSLLLEPKAQTSGGVSASQLVKGTHTRPIGVSVDTSLADRPLPVPKHTGLILRPERYTLGNKLKVVMWSASTVPLAYGRLVVKSGIADDPKGAEGTSWLVGGTNDYLDSTVFSERSLSPDIYKTVESLAMELRFSSRGISDERKDILKKNLGTGESPESRAYQHRFVTALYGKGHPYARSAMSPRSIKRIDRDALTSWAKRHITPANSTLILVGRFDRQLVKKHVDFNAGHVSSGSPSRRPLKQLRTAAPAWIVGKSRATEPTVRISMGFAGTPGIGNDHAARLVLAAILNGKLSALRDQLAVSYGFSAGYSPAEMGGRWTLGGAVDARRAGEAASALVDVLQKLRQDPTSYRAQFVVARRSVAQSLLSSASSSRAIANRLALMARFDLGDDYYHKLVHQVANLTPEQVHRLITTELSTSRQVMGAFGPNSAANAAIKAAQARQSTRVPKDAN